MQQNMNPHVLRIALDEIMERQAVVLGMYPRELQWARTADIIEDVAADMNVSEAALFAMFLTEEI